MGYLLAPFPPSDKPLDLNDSKFRFWSSLILSSSKELLKPFASVRDLQERFRWNGQSTPGCLNTVLEGMERTGEATKMPDFYQAEQSWLSWGANVVKKPVAWALKSYLPTSKYEGDYVINNVARVSFARLNWGDYSIVFVFPGLCCYCDGHTPADSALQVHGQHHEAR